jgi:hypothetical protein
MYILKDVSGLNYEDGLKELIKFELGVEYIESNSPKDEILYTIPSAGKVVYEGQMVNIYVSKGHNREVYQNLVNELYDNKKLYLMKLVEEYQLNLEIVYKKDNMIIDGLICNVELEDEFVDKNDTQMFFLMYEYQCSVIQYLELHYLK